MDNISTQMEKHMHEPGYGSDCLVAFHGDDSLKQRYVDQVVAHHKAGHIQQGDWYSRAEFTASGHEECCAIGTLVEENTFNDYTSYAICKAYANMTGIPWYLASLQECIFEGYADTDEAAQFVVDFIKAIPVGFNDWDDLLRKVIIQNLEAGDSKFTFDRFQEGRDPCLEENLEILKGILNHGYPHTPEENKALEWAIDRTDFHYPHYAQEFGKAVIDYFREQA